MSSGAGAREKETADLGSLILILFQRELPLAPNNGIFITQPSANKNKEPRAVSV